MIRLPGLPILTCNTVYVGKAASLSFLQLLRDTVNQHIGPSQFSHNVRSEDMLETETPHHVASEDHFNRDQKRAFVETYFMAVCCHFWFLPV